MPKKPSPPDSGSNTVTITNSNASSNNHVNVTIGHSGNQDPEKEKSEPNWYVRTIVGGIIALLLSLCGYYLKKSMDKDKENVLSSEPVINPVHADR